MNNIFKDKFSNRYILVIKSFGNCTDSYAILYLRVLAKPDFPD